MNFRPRRQHEAPEINFIPLIDLLLVILIFLMITTTYNRLNGLKIELPAANSAPVESLQSRDIVVVVTADGWKIDHDTVTTPDALQQALSAAAQGREDDAWVIIYADAATPYQRVIDAMQAAQAGGLTRITMATDTHPS